jgi:hypothetical protein
MPVGNREVGDDVAIDATMQPISEAPYWQDDDGETVAVATDDATGEVTTTGLDADRGPDEPGQSTLDDWGWSA